MWTSHPDFNAFKESDMAMVVADINGRLAFKCNRIGDILLTKLYVVKLAAASHQTKPCRAVGQSAMRRLDCRRVRYRTRTDISLANDATLCAGTAVIKISNQVQAYTQSGSNRAYFAVELNTYALTG